MQTYAKLGSNNKVINIVSVDDEHCTDGNGQIDNETGRQWLESVFGYPNWQLATNYNGCTRKAEYDEDQDCFIPPKPFASWTWDTAQKCWVAPTEKPENADYWNEESQTWV